VKTAKRSLSESLQAEDYGWVDSLMRSRGRAESVSGDEETASIIVESDLVRTALFTILLGALACLLAQFSIYVAKGEGRSIFRLTATLAAFLACGAVASRRRWWLRSVLVLGSLCVSALLADQLAYYHWHKRISGLVTTLQQDVKSGSPALPGPMTLRPTSFWIDPDQEVLLTFEPPLMAWTYQLDSVSSLGHTLVTGWYRILSRVTRGRDLDSVGRALVHPHEAYSVRVRSSERTLACQDGEKSHWTLSIDTGPGAPDPRTKGHRAPAGLPAS